MNTYCRHCDGAIFQFDKAPRWSPDGWALDLSDDPVHDFICPARSSRDNLWPHEPRPYEPDLPYKED